MMVYEQVKGMLTCKQRKLVEYALERGDISWEEIITFFYNDKAYAKQVMVKLCRLGLFRPEFGVYQVLAISSQRKVEVER